MFRLALVLLTAGLSFTETRAQAVFVQAGADSPYGGVTYSDRFGETPWSVEALAFVTPTWAEALIGPGYTHGAVKAILFVGFEAGGTPRGAMQISANPSYMSFLLQLERGQDDWGGMAVVEARVGRGVGVGLHLERGVGIGPRGSVTVLGHVQVYTAVVINPEAEEDYLRPIVGIVIF